MNYTIQPRMNYSSYTREQLLTRIEELDLLNREILKVNEQSVTLEYSWTGNLGHWYWNVQTNRVTFNPLKVTALGYDKSEIPEHVTYAFFTEKLHPDDYGRIMSAMEDHLAGKSAVYEVEYRIQTKGGKYKWYYDLGKVTQRDESGKPLFLAGIVFDITEKKETYLELELKNKILAEFSITDALTKIGNYRTLIDHLNANIARSIRTGSFLSIAIFDIDEFKKVNDTKGHIYGDQVLADVAQILKKTVRDTDFLGRYGGEEFMVIFPDTGLASAMQVSERIRGAVENHSFVEGLKITISGGVRQFEGEALTDFIRLADTHLYEAKARGKNQIAP